MVKFVRSKEENRGPSSALGIMQFFDTESKSPKLSPTVVVAAAAVFIVIILAIKLLTR